MTMETLLLEVMGAALVMTLGYFKGYDDAGRRKKREDSECTE